jgi:hypothetical protein
MIRRFLSVAVIGAGLAVGCSALAEDAQRLQGLFCNTEAQIDQALANIAGGVSPRHAADLANLESVVCNYVDRIEYLIARPVALGATSLPIVKYRGALVGVIIGGALKPVVPEAEVYFLTPREVVDAAVEEQT